MEPLLVLLALAVVVGPWILAGVALARATRLSHRVDALEARTTRLPAPEPVLPTTLGFKPAAPPPTPAAPPAPPAGAPIAAAPSTRPAAPVRAASTATGPGSLEERIALVWLTRAGALVVLVGAATFFKWAVDNDWIGPTGRVALGVVAGAGAIAGGEALRARTRALWVNVLQGAGVALLFISAFAAAALYHVVPYPAAFAAVAVVAAAGGGLSLRGRSEVVLALSLAGALIAPVVLSTGEDRPVALLGWLLLASGASLAVSARLGFRIVPWLAMAGTTALAAAWYGRYFDVHAPPALPDPNLPAEAQRGAYHALSARALPSLLALANVGAWLLAWERARPRREGDARAWPRPLADLWLALSLAALHAVAFAFLHDRPPYSGLALALAGLAAAFLAGRSGRRELHPLAAALGGLLVAAAIGKGLGSIAAAALWALAHLGAAARSLLARPEGSTESVPPAPSVLAAAIAGLGFSGLALLATRTHEDLLRAALVGAAAVAELGLGAVMLARGRGGAEGSRRIANVMLGSALALAAAALAFLLSGASITVAWAALGAAVAVVAARERDRAWQVGALAVLALALGRALGVDLAAPRAAHFLFLETNGVEGAYRMTPFLNARAVALVAVAVALLVSARAMVKVSGWRQIGGVLATAAHLALLALLVTEAREAVLSLPAAPSAGDALAFRDLRVAVARATAEQAGALDTTTTVVMGLYAVVLVGIGFLAREVLHRWLGLGLFAATLAKLVLSDVWRLGRGQQILVFLAVGALMLGAGFLYARYGRRILGLLSLLVAAGVPAAAPAAAALDPAPFRTLRTVEGVERPGLHAVRVDAPLWQASLAEPGTLADVRIASPAGDEVRWALRRVAGQDAESEVQGTLVDPVVLPGGALRAMVDKGRAGLRSDELRLDLDGDDFLRPVRVESSDDGRAFGVLVEGPRVYAVRDVAGARRTTVLHPPSDARFLRVTVLAGGGEVRRISGARPFRRAAVPPPVDALELPAPARTASPDGRTSFLDLDLGAAGVPVNAAVLVTGATAFERRVRVLASVDGRTFSEVGGGLAFRVPGDEELRVAIRSGGRRFVRVAIEDGDAPPLPVTVIRLLWPAHEIVLDAGAAGPYVLHAGAEGQRAPSYDLAAVLARAPDAPVLAARLGPSRPNPAYAAAQPALPFTERHKAALAVALGLVLLAVGAFAFRLLRTAP